MDNYGQSAIPSYLVFAIVASFINPITGLLAIASSMLSKQKLSHGDRWWARFFSDIAYGSAFTGILVTILLILLLYAFGHFPESAYYDRDELLK